METRPEGSEVDRAFELLIEKLDAGTEFDVNVFLVDFPEIAVELRRRLQKLEDLGILRAQTSTASPRDDRGRHRDAEPAAFAPAPAPPDAEQLLRSRQTGKRYRLLDPLGKGGMGEVVRALDMDLGREVAMKLVRRPDAGPAGASEHVRRLERFLSEAQVTGKLEHPNIVPVHDVGIADDGRLFFTMKIVGGRTLHDLIESPREGDRDVRRTMPFERRLGIALAICDALGYAHSKGVVHRDLKPGNVMVGEFGEVQLMDWGLARILAAPGDETPGHQASTETTRSDAVYQTRDGDVFGTPSYMAPEQARGERAKIDERTDVFGVGAILYHLLAGQAPYRAATLQGVRDRARQGELNDPDMRQARERVPLELRAVCQRALAARKEDRYATIGDLAADLRAFLEDRTGQAWRDSPVGRLKKLVRRHPAWAVGSIGLTLLIALGLVGWAALGKARLRERELSTWQTFERVVASTSSRARESTDDFSAWEPVEVLRRRVEAGITIYEPLGIDLREMAPEQILKQVEYIQARNPALVDKIVPAIYELGWFLQRAMVVSADHFQRGGVHHPIGPRTRARLQELVQEAPDLIALWNKLAELIPQLPASPWRRQVWSAFVRWADDFQLPPPELARSAESSEDAIEVGWYGGLLFTMSRTNTSREVLDQATALLQRSLKLDGSNYWTHVLLSVLFASPGPGRDLERAEQHARTACHLDAKALNARTNLAAILMEKPSREALAEALDTIEWAIQRGTTASQTWNNYGEILRRLGRSEESLVAFDRSLALNPNSERAHFNRGLLLSDTGRIPEAVEEFRRATDLSATYMKAWERLYDGLRALHRADEALAACDRILALDPKRADMHLARGNELRRLTSVREARAAYRRATELDPSMGEAYANLAETAHEIGEYAEAETAYGRALELLPLQHGLFRRRAGARLALGKSEEALADLEHVVALWGADLESGVPIHSPEETLASLRAILADEPALSELAQNGSQRDRASALLERVRMIVHRRDR